MDIMKKLIISLLTVFAVLPVIGQTKLDTLYYDKNWKSISTPAFASYYRVLERTSDAISFKPYRSYFITGDIQAEGGYITLDSDDDSKSIFDGDYEIYYKSGQIAEKGSWERGKREGEYTQYDENGLILKHLYYSNGELNGICTEFTDDGVTCTQIEYSNGQPLYDYYVISNKDGLCSVVSLSDGKPIYESPTPEDMKLEYIDDLPWVSCEKNGIAMRINSKYRCYTTSLIITNNSMFPIEVGAEHITETCMNKKGTKEKPLKVLTYREFSWKEKQGAAADKYFTAMGEQMLAKNAGKSYSQTTTTHAGTTGSGKSYSGTTTSVTTSYNATAAYQAQIMARDRIAAYSQAVDAETKVRDEGYLKKTTLHPGETIVGYVEVRKMLFKDTFYVTINVEISGVKYTSKWLYDVRHYGINPNPVME
ncbi:MAG: hypothetical protein LUC18_04620 [Porphyromonadaceae bacterium]|nr:hypothetical protein [Porphyromonadaceae bacterium]